MAEKKQTSGSAILRAIEAARRSKATADRSSSSIRDTLIKSPQWKKNTLQKIESTQSDENADTADTAPREARVRRAFKRLRERLARRLKELNDARRQLSEQSATLQRRSEEKEQLRRTIAKLEAEIENLTTEHRADRDARRVELLQFQEAYDQFEQQTDRVLDELHQQNEQLRVVSGRGLRRSMH